MRILLAAVALLLAAIAPVRADTLHLKTPRGAEIEVIVDLPQAVTRAPAIVVAPGRGYTKDGPIFVALAGRAVRAGYAVVRFDWAYTARKGTPSAGLKDELEDVQAAIGLAMKHEKIDPARVAIVGKSLGSVVAHRAFVADPRLAIEVLLTPIMPSREDALKNYAGLFYSTRPALIVLGSGDADNTPLSVLYGVLGEAARPIPIAVVGGDHGLNVVDPDDASGAARNRANIEVAVDALIHGVDLALGR